MTQKLVNSTITLVLSLMVLVTGCRNSDVEVPHTVNLLGAETRISSPERILVCSDTLSTDLASDFGVLLLNDIAASSTGELAILDGASSTVTLIDSEGVISTTGGSGQGPGEFQQPISVALSDEGIIAVSDLMAGTVRIYQPHFESYQDVNGFFMANPGVMYITGDSSFTAMRVYFRTDNDETVIGHQTALWVGNDSDPVHVYTENMRSFDLSDFGASVIAPYPMTTNSEGVVFVADVSTEKYILSSYNSQGDILWISELPFQPLEKTEEEINFEEDLVIRRMQQSPHQVNYVADPYHFAVVSLALGPEERLWVERPGYGNTHFDIFEPATGEYLFSASAEGEFDILKVTPGGIFAVPSGMYQSLLLLNLSGT